MNSNGLFGGVRLEGMLGGTGSPATQSGGPAESFAFFGNMSWTPEVGTVCSTGKTRGVDGTDKPKILAAIERRKVPLADLSLSVLRYHEGIRQHDTYFSTCAGPMVCSTMPPYCGDVALACHQRRCWQCSSEN